jgi:D-tyrosyl-tRNA(Tyr) deacylase
MRAIIQRVEQASVTVDDKIISEIKSGFLVLIAIKTGDTIRQAEKMALKIANLRIIADNEGKMNLSLLNAGGSVLLVSQFTLYANTDKGHRPSFLDSAPPEEAEPLIDVVVQKLEALNISVSLGQFAKHMKVQLTNDGPTTIILDL